MVLYFGPAIFKISRLLVIAMSCVHIFACVFYRVKKESAENIEAMEQFYSSRNVDPNVSIDLTLHSAPHILYFELIFAVSSCSFNSSIWSEVELCVQDLGQTYVSESALETRFYQ